MPSHYEIEQFSSKIEHLAFYHQIPFLEAILEQCTAAGLEVDVAATLISESLHQKMMTQAEELNLLKRTSRRRNSSKLV